MLPKEERDGKHQQQGGCAPGCQRPPEQRLVASRIARQKCRSHQHDDFVKCDCGDQQVEAVVVGVGDDREQKIVLRAHTRGEHLRDVHPLLFIDGWQ